MLNNVVAGNNHAFPGQKMYRLEGEPQRQGNGGNLKI
jgi:hypothetical protein